MSFTGIIGSQFPINSTELATLQKELKVLSDSENWIDHCLNALVSYTLEPKTQAVQKIRHAIEPVAHITNQESQTILTNIAVLAKNSALSKLQLNKNSELSTSAKQKLEWIQKKCEEELIETFALQLFQCHSEETLDDLLQDKFPYELKLEILKIIAKGSPENKNWLTSHIKKLNIKEQDRFILAKIIVQGNLQANSPGAMQTRSVSTIQKANAYIKSFDITSPELIVDILKIAISNNYLGVKGLSTLKNLDQQHLTELVQHALSLCPYLIFNIPRELIKDKNCMAEIFLYIVKNAGKPAYVFDFYKFPENLNTLEQVFEIIMGPHKTVFEADEYVVPIKDVISKLEGFTHEKNHPLKLQFIINILENQTLSKEEIQLILYWFTWTVELMYRKLTPEQIDWVIQQRVLEQVAAFREPLMRYQLSETIVQVASSAVARENYEKFNQDGVKHTQLANLFLSQMQTPEVNLEDVSQKIKSLRTLRESSNNKLMISILEKVRDSNDLILEDKVNLLNFIFDSSDCSTEMYRTLTIIEMNQSQLLQTQNLKSLKEAEHLAYSNSAKFIFNDKINGDNLHKYGDLFSRNPSAFFIYTTKMFTIKDGSENKVKLINCITLYLESVLSGTFSQIRYDKSKSKHLQTVFAGEANPLLEAWKTNKTTLLNDLFGEIFREESQSIDFENVLRNNMQHILHLPHSDYVQRFLNESDPAQRSIIDKEIGMLISELTKKKTEQDRKDLEYLKFAQSLIKLARQKIIVPQITPENMNRKQAIEESYRASKKGIVKLISQIEKMSQHITLLPEFIDSLYDSIPKDLDSALYKDWTITITDNHQDLLLCGTEVLGSCQRINGLAAYNKCLVAYLIDGKNQLLAIKDAAGKIKMRAILRILLDEHTNKPVLFMEKIYPEIPAPKLAQALQQFAIIRAKELGIPLLTQQNFLSTHLTAYNSPIQSMGGPAPYEYVDALKGIQNNSEFKIRFSGALYNPPANVS